MAILRNCLFIFHPQRRKLPRTHLISAQAVAPASGSDRGQMAEAPAQSALSKFFLIEERGSTVMTEIRAGVVTFLTMSYILLVNPQILSQVRALPMLLLLSLGGRTSLGLAALYVFHKGP